MATGPKGAVKHVVILVQENHTTDNYFRSLGAYGANVSVAMAAPPGFGARISLPPPPKQRPSIPPLPGPPGPPKQVSEVVLRGGATLPPPDDVVLPQQPGPPPSFTPRPGTKPKPPGKPKPKGRGQTSHSVPYRQPRGGSEKGPRGPTKQRSRKRKR
jgi:hypothetical protein